MRHTLIYLLVAVVTILTFAGCDNSSEVSQPSLVIDGWIDSDGYPVVILTKTIVPDASDKTPVADCLVRWAKVTVSDGEREVIMTGTSDDNYFPPYIYRTFDMRGEPGKTYRVTASYGGMTAEASCKMPQRARITGISVARIEGSDSLCEISMSFVPAPGERYYHLLTRIRGDRGRYMPSFMGTVKTDGTGEELKVPVFAPKTDTSPDDFTPYYKRGDLVEIALCTVTPEVYDFWFDYDDVVAFGGNQFVTSAGNLRSNVIGGYGVWSAQGTVRHTLLVTPR